MTKTNASQQRPPSETLACVNPDCKLYGQAGQGNLTVRKVYGKDGIRYLRCRCCQTEFSERKGTALWNTKVSEAKAEAVAAHLAEGCSRVATTRLVKVDVSVVKRLNQCLGKHGQAFHNANAQQLHVAHVRVQQHIADAALVGQQHHQTIHAHAEARYFTSRMCGYSSTSRMLRWSVSNITKRSTPMPKPPHGGIP
jgi:hypothetical protein